MDAADYFIKAMEQKKQLVQNAKIADTAMKVNPELLERTGMSVEDFASKSAKDKVAIFMGAVQGLAQEAEGLKISGEREKLKSIRQEAGARERFAAAVQAGFSGTDKPAGAGAMQFMEGSRPTPLRPGSRFEAMSGDDMLRMGMESGLDTRSLYELGSVARQMRPRFEPGSVKEIPGVAGYKFVHQSPEGAGSVIPVGGMGGAASRRTPGQEEADLARAHHYDTAPQRDAIQQIDRQLADLSKLRTELRAKKRTDAVVEQLNDLLSQEKSLQRRRKEMEEKVTRKPGGKTEEADDSAPDAAEGAKVREAFKAGKISREEALKRLKALGFK
jgi:hypothetical protein